MSVRGLGRVVLRHLLEAARLASYAHPLCPVLPPEAYGPFGPWTGLPGPPPVRRPELNAYDWEVLRRLEAELAVPPARPGDS
jgi:hypothetical protein